MRIELKRGLLRVWVVIAVAWIGLMGWSEYKSGWGPFPREFHIEGECWDRVAKWPDGKAVTNPFEIFDERTEDKARWGKEIVQKLKDCEAAAPTMRRLSLKVSDVWFDLKNSLPVILLPPFALLIAGYITGWVINGFRAHA